jgi:hypothetical protein
MKNRKQPTDKRDENSCPSRIRDIWRPGAIRIRILHQGVKTLELECIHCFAFGIPNFGSRP